MAEHSDNDKLVGKVFEQGSNALTVTYVTTSNTATHSVTVRDSYHGWVDVGMAHTERGGRNTWTADLVTPAEEGPVRIEFKLVFDGLYWMAGGNQVGTTANPPASIDFDDDSVMWETEPH